MALLTKGRVQMQYKFLCSLDRPFKGAACEANLSPEKVPTVERHAWYASYGLRDVFFVFVCGNNASCMNYTVSEFY